MTVSLMKNNVILRAKHVPGKKNVIADAISGYPGTAVWPQARTIGHPAESHALATVTQQLLDGALSNLSTRAYKKNVERFQQFCKSELHITCWFPAKTPAVVSFIAFGFQKGYASSSITSALSAISYIHKMHNLDDQTATFVVRKLLQGAAKLRPSLQ